MTVRVLDPITLYEGTAPGSEEWTEPETEWSVSHPLAGDRPMTFAWNVSRPTLTPVLPAEGTSIGVAALVLPGGAYFTLGMDYEGTDVATWLAERGIASFVLKYRLQQTEIVDDSTYGSTLMSVGSPEGLSAALSRMDDFSEIPLADGVRALSLVRSHLSASGNEDVRIGAIGFSAGARLAHDLAGSALAPERLAFLAGIYGPRGCLPHESTPLFLAVSADDAFYPDVKATDEDWRDAGYSVESHYYPDGGHGWGARPRNATTDGWLDSFHRWIEWTRKAAH